MVSKSGINENIGQPESIQVLWFQIMWVTKSAEANRQLIKMRFNQIKG
jgi:hypothetical protein